MRTGRWRLGIVSTCVMVLALAAGCTRVTGDSRGGGPRPGTAAPSASAAAASVTTPARLITLLDLAQSLPAQPISVGFDVDDTVLFSSPGFQYGNAKYGERVIFGRDLTDAERQRSQAFWNEMNNGLDEWSVPKWVARELIRLHAARGDTIYFVTARPPSQPPQAERLTEILKARFRLERVNPVMFVGRESKAATIREKRMEVFYGDSDGDIRAALEASAGDSRVRPIRVKRARTSTNLEPTNDGDFGEEVLIDSEF